MARVAGTEPDTVPETFLVYADHGCAYFAGRDRILYSAPLANDGTIIWSEAGPVEYTPAGNADECDAIAAVLRAEHVGRGDYR